MYRLFLAALLMVATCVQADQDPLTEMAVESFREAAATQTSTDLEQQAKLMMQVKNGLSLYRDGALQESDKAALKGILARQLAAANAALGKGPEKRQKLAVVMRDNAQAAQQVLSLNPAAPGFTSKMSDYHNGIGYKAYRYAQDIGIEQL